VEFSIYLKIKIKDNLLFSIFYRTLTYCFWNLMAGEDQQDIKTDRVALPPPTKRRDHHLRKLVTEHHADCNANEVCQAKFI